MGNPWNEINNKKETAGCIALKENQLEIYQHLVDEGVRSELLLSLFDEDEEEIVNEDYLKSDLEFNVDSIIDNDKNGVMMDWETPLMYKHAEIICPKPDLTILNVGFGMGIIDRKIQELKPKKHVIVEAHPKVYEKMKQAGWDKKEGVEIIFGRWQDKIHEISKYCYDGIFFDTFGEDYKQLKAWHDHLPNFLNVDGIYSFFNGLGADVQLFYDVYKTIVSLHLLDCGIETSFISLDVEIDFDTWKNCKREYWKLKKYYLPVCSFKSD